MATGYTAPQIITLVAQGITCVLSILGNGLVIWVAGFRMARTVTTLCYLNLALADFFCAATLPFFMVVNAMRTQWPFGWFLCKLFNIMFDTNLYGSVFLIAFIALDRCVCVLYPVWAQNHRTVSLAKKVILVPWILALVFTLPALIFLTTVRDEEGKEYCGFNTEFWGNITEEEMLPKVVSTVRIIGINRFVIGFTIPMSVIAICYGLVAAKIRKKGMSNSSRPLRVLTAVVVSFFICWFPMQMCLLLYTVSIKAILLEEKYHILGLLIYLTAPLAFFNSCLNPMLYVFLGRNFRMRLIQSLPASLERALTEDLDPASETTKSVSPPTEAELQEI